MLKQVKNDALYWLTAGMLRLLGWLPVRLVLGLGPVVGKLAHVVAWPERRRARANLQRAELDLRGGSDDAYPRRTGRREQGARPKEYLRYFECRATQLSASRTRGMRRHFRRGGLGCDARAQRRIVRDVFVQLGRSAMECVALNARGGESRRPRCHRVQAHLLPAARESFQRALVRGRGVVFVSAHFGNWELLGAAIAQVAPTYVLARRSYDPRFSRLIERFRAQNGMQTIWVEDAGALRRAASALKRGAVVAVLLDQPVRAGGLSIPFLGRPASTSRVAASLCRATGAGLEVGFIHRISPGRHLVSMEQVEVTSSPHRRHHDLVVSEALTRRIEVAVRDDPGSWLWTLDRWRPSTHRPAQAGPGRTPLASYPNKADRPPERLLQG